MLLEDLTKLLLFIRKQVENCYCEHVASVKFHIIKQKNLYIEILHSDTTGIRYAGLQTIIFKIRVCVYKFVSRFANLNKMHFSITTL